MAASVVNGSFLERMPSFSTFATYDVPGFRPEKTRVLPEAVAVAGANVTPSVDKNSCVPSATAPSSVSTRAACVANTSLSLISAPSMLRLTVMASVTRLPHDTRNTTLPSAATGSATR